MVDIKELFEFQQGTIKQYNKAVRSIRERFTVSKTLNKHIETIATYLDIYEIMYNELNKVREVSSIAMRSNELETIEREFKVLNDTFWD